MFKILKGITLMHDLVRFLAMVFVLLSSSANAAVATPSLKVALLSVTGSDGNILLQTSPRHSISGLGCTSDFWSVLPKSDPGYEAMLSQLLAAQAAQLDVSITVDTFGDGRFCRLTRVVTHAP